MKEPIAGRTHVALGRRWVGPPSDDGKSQAKKNRESGRVCFEVSKLRDLEATVRNAFKLALHYRFEGLQQLMAEEEELPVDVEWRQIEQGYVKSKEKEHPGNGVHGQG